MEDNKDKEQSIKLDSIIDLNTISSNSLIIFRVPQVNENVYKAIEGLKGQFLEQIKDKNITFLVMKPDSKIESVDEKYMESIGYYRKDKSRIIH